MRQETFLKSLFTIGIGTVINLLIGLLTTPIITRLVDPVEYGQFSIFLMYTNIAIAVFCLGMDQALVRFYYKSNDIAYKRRVVGESVFFPLLSAIVCITACILLIGLKIIRFEFHLGFTVVLGINILFNLLLRFSSLLVRLEQNNKLFAFINVIQKITYVVMALFFLKLMHMSGIFSLAFSSLLGVIICVAISIISQIQFLPRRNNGLNKEEMYEMLKFGLPFVFSLGVNSVFQSLDKISLNHYRSYREVGIYSSAMMFVALFSVVQTSFNTVWAPKSIEHYTKNPDDKEFYKSMFNMIAVIMLALGITLILLKDFFVYLLGTKYREAASIMPFLIFEPIMYTVSETTVVGVNFAKRSGYHVWIALGACLLNLIGNTILVPFLGCKGAAISTGISYIFFFALRTFFGEKCFRVGYCVDRFIIVVLFMLGYAVYNTFFDFTIINIISAMVCYCVMVICYKDTIMWGWSYIKKRFPIKKKL